MASTHAKDSMMSASHNGNSYTLTRLSELFGAHKAEWLGPRLFDLFSGTNLLPPNDDLTPLHPHWRKGHR